MYGLEIKEEVDKIFSKLSKKNKTQLIIIPKKNRSNTLSSLSPL